jgi:ferrous iron transport protein A
VELQLSGKNGSSGTAARPALAPGMVRLADLHPGETGVLEAINLPEEDARRLMELGFLPGSVVTAARRSPFGDPHLFQVDGSEIAIRRETAQQLLLSSRSNGA